MRKQWWLGAAVLAAAGLMWAVHQPDSAVGHRLAHWCPARPCERDSCRCDPDACGVESPENVRSESDCGEDSPCPDASVDLGPAPPAIVIPEFDTAAPAAGDLAAFEVDQGATPTAMGMPADIAGCPLNMPYCLECDAPPMPYAIDAGAPAEQPAAVEAPRDEAPQNRPAPPASTDMSNPGRCEEDPQYNQHYSGCPASGSCPYGGCYGADRYNLLPPSRPTPPAPQSSPGEESEEPPTTEPAKPLGTDKEKQKPRKTPETRVPTTSELDTMEYRRSDGSLTEFGPGPI